MQKVWKVQNTAVPLHQEIKQTHTNNLNKKQKFTTIKQINNQIQYITTNDYRRKTANTCQIFC